MPPLDPFLVREDFPALSDLHAESLSHPFHRSRPRPDPDVGEVLRGAAAIAAYLRILMDDPNISDRTARRWLLERQIPSNGKLGRDWLSTKTLLRRHFMGDGNGAQSAK